MRYCGKTGQGEEILFEISEGHISNIKSSVQVLCTDVGGSYDAKFEFQPFLLPGSFEIGSNGRFSLTQTVEGTTYEIEGETHGPEASGTLRLRYSRVTFDPLTYNSGQVFCSAKVEWNASSVAGSD